MNEVENNCVNHLDNLSLHESPPDVSVNFFNLPRELQLHIFSFFELDELCETVAPVCRDWWELSKDPSLWKDLDIYVHSEEETKKLAPLLERNPMLTGLSINTNFSLEEFAVTSRACPKVKYLDLCGCEQLDDQVLALFVKNCPLVEVLSLEGCGEIKTKSAESIACLRFLRTLHLGLCNINDEDIQMILEKCTRLADLDLLGVKGITNKSIRKIVDNLNSTLCRLRVNCDIVTDSAFQIIGLCTKLQSLWIACGSELTDQTLRYLKMLPGLKSLSFITVTLMTTTALNDFFTGPHVQKLVHLVLVNTSIDNHGIYNITQYCKSLKTFSLRRLAKVTEVGLEHVVNHCCDLTELSLLELDSITGHCLTLIPEKLKSLESLSVSYCDDINDVESVLIELSVRVPKLSVYHNYELISS